MNSNFFGLHDKSLYSYSHLNVGAVRLWDTGVTWKDIETSAGVFNFTRLDTQVNTALANGASITLVLGQTPAFYGSAPTVMPPQDKFENYVRAVASRYKGKIDYYQVWNEANNTMFFTGTPSDMARLTKIVYTAVRAYDSVAQIVAPSGPIRRTYQVGWYKNYFNSVIDGYQPYRWINCVGFSMYPLAGGGPEDMISLMGPVYDMMDAASVPVSKQIVHASEINYNVETGTAIDLASDSEQIAKVMRTYLVGAVGGFARLHWYRYDWGLDSTGHPLGDTYLTDPHNFDSVSPAGLAFNRVQDWTAPGYNGYHITSGGTYVTHFGSKDILWNPTQTEGMAGYTGKKRTRQDGFVEIIDTAKTYIGQYPVMIG